MTGHAASIILLTVGVTLAQLSSPAAAGEGAARERPADIIDVADVVPDLALDMRYLTSYNFIGHPIPGYRAPKCLLNRRAAMALKKGIV